MKKTILAFAFSFVFINASIAAENVEKNSLMPLTQAMDKNMRTLIKTYTEYLGKELQLRGTDLYVMGQGLLFHKDHPQCQADGKKAVELAQQIYKIGQMLLEGKEVSSKEAADFVNTWTGNPTGGSSTK